MVIPVRAGLLVVEAEGMEQLVLDSAVVQAALSAQGHRLTATLTTHVGVAAVVKERTEGFYAQLIKYGTTAMKLQRNGKAERNSGPPVCRMSLMGIFNPSDIPFLTLKQGPNSASPFRISEGWWEEL